MRGGKKEAAAPKGHVAVRVGVDGDEMERFVVPVEYVNHPLFVRMLKEAEAEYGFEHMGAVRIPCHVEDFRHVRGIIDREIAGHGIHFPNCFKP